MQIKALLLAPLLAVGLVHANAAVTSQPFEKAVCKSKPSNQATFQIVNGELFLYTTSNVKQKAFTDRSSMGQGVFQYTSSTNLPAEFETKGWAIDKYGNLNFKGSGFLACPGAISNSWSLWVYAGVANPGGNKNCLGFTARTAAISEPNCCTYTVRQ